MHAYKHRVKRKYCKYARSHGEILALALIARYILRDSLTYILSLLIKRISRKEASIRNKRVLFVEPFQQGFGDLIFQTPLFESLSRKGFEVYIVLNKEHLPIIEDNPFVKKIIVKKTIKYWFEIFFVKFETVFVLSRDTVPESLIPIIKLRSQIILMDSDLKYWQEIFSKNHTLAWQLIFRKYFDESLKFNRPQIFFEKKSFGSKKQIGVIAGIDKEEKGYKEIFTLITKLKETNIFDIILLGKNKNWIQVDEVRDLVNKLTYKETIEKICECNLIVGTESSLIHVSTTLKVPTLVIENRERPFDKYSILGTEGHIFKIDQDEAVDKIANYIKSIFQNSPL